MKLAYKKAGEGQPLIILHGLFGSADNWQTLGKKFSEDFEVYLVDQRNHGRSAHDKEWNYDVMAEDVQELIMDHHLENVILLGHSMGGKTVMQAARNHPEKLDKLIVADIAPKDYHSNQDEVAAALLSVDLRKIKSRKEAEEALSLKIKDNPTKQFLLKNLYWKTDEELAWRFNLEVVAKNLDIIAGTFHLEDKVSDLPVLFMRGERSDYIRDKDMDLIKRLFPNSQLATIPNAGHWLHADQPELFYNAVLKFIKKS